MKRTELSEKSLSQHRAKIQSQVLARQKNKTVIMHEPCFETPNSFKLYTLLPAGRSHQQSGTATNKLNINLNGLQVTAKYMSSGDLIVGRLGVATCRTIRTSVNLKYKRKPLLIYIVIKSFKCFITFRVLPQ